MAAFHYAESENMDASKLTPDDSNVHVTSDNDQKLITLPAHSSHQNKAIVVQMASKPNTLTTTKLKSLLPKNLLGLLPKAAEADVSPSQIREPRIQPADIIPSSPSADFIMTAPSTVNMKPHDYTHSIEVNATENTSDSLENILQHIQNSLISASVINAEDGRAHSYSDAEQEKLLVQTGEEVQNYVTQAVDSSRSLGEKHLLTPVTSSSHQMTEELDKEQDVVKKTMVEAFVKMVVCRKVTVQKVDAKTGQILDTKVKTEEEEPVILGVDCVETTEDLMSSSTEPANENNSTDLTTSKWAASVDGGLKFLSAVSESRQKIGKSVIKDKLLKSSSQKGALKLVGGTGSDVMEPAIELSQTYTVEASTSQNTASVKIENESDLEWNEELNDNSEDYVPGGSKKNAKLASRNQGYKTDKSIRSEYRYLANMNQANVKEEPSETSETNNMNSSPVILLPRKRGRKRKWDNALGMAANLRTCQFCSKHFSNIQACAKHMKKGKCVSSVFCLICSKPFSNEHELEIHLLTHGNDTKSGAFECRDCNRAYRTRAGYVKHFRMGTCLKRDEFEDGLTGDFECDLCESRFSTIDYLKLHRYKVHENPKDTHTCPDCGKRFYSTQGYNKHRGGRPCTEPLKCKICGKTYSSKAKESFKIHMKHHRSEVTGITFQCDECDRSYMTQMALTKHKLSHTGVKPYKCDVCGKEFSMRYMVKDHARMHTGERPYLCSLCGSAFSNKGHLGRHLRSHENGTLLKRGRPKKIKEPEENNAQETELKMIDLGQTLQNLDGQTIQVVDGHLFESQSSGTPMIIQASNNTIIIAEGWPNANVGSALAIPSSQDVANVTASIISSGTQ